MKIFNMVQEWYNNGTTMVQMWYKTIKMNIKTVLKKVRKEKNQKKRI